MGDKPKIMQHIVDAYLDVGGPAAEYKRLMESSLRERYDFIPLIQREAPHGLNFSLLKDMMRQVKREKPDMVHVRGLHSEGFYALLAARLGGCKKVLVCVHGTYTDSLSITFVKKLIFGKILEPFTLRNADLVYCVCDYAAKRPYICKNTRHMYGYIHNVAPDYSIGNATLARKKIRTELGVGKEEIVTVTVGRVTFDKGYHYLAGAIKLLKEKGCRVRHLVIGEGDYFDVLKHELAEEIARGEVMLLGKRPDVRDVLFASDIFVFPTLHENLSCALLEASAAGLAIVASNVGGNPEVINHNQTGLLVPAKDAVALADSMRKLIENANERKRLAANAQENARQNFSQQVLFERIRVMYDSLLER